MSENIQPLPPYKGTEPYIFISYSHINQLQALKIVERLQKEGYRVWYDEGIDPGTEWDDNIAEHVLACGYFVALISENYLASENCKDELNLAREENKQRLLVYLEDVTLPAGMRMRLNRLQAIHKYKYQSEDGFMEKFRETRGIECCFEEQAQKPVPEEKEEKTSAPEEKGEQIPAPEKKEEQIPAPEKMETAPQSNREENASKKTEADEKERSKESRQISPKKEEAPLKVKENPPALQKNPPVIRQEQRWEDFFAESKDVKLEPSYKESDTKPHLFIDFVQADEAKAKRIIAHLQQKGYRVAYPTKGGFLKKINVKDQAKIATVFLPLISQSYIKERGDQLDQLCSPIRHDCFIYLERCELKPRLAAKDNLKIHSFLYPRNFFNALYNTRDVKRCK